MASASHPEILARSSGSFPQLLDMYVLRRFFYYFALLMGAFVLLFETFTFSSFSTTLRGTAFPF